MSVELPNLFGPSAAITSGGLATLADIIVLLRSVELHAQIHHLISVLKKRGMTYDLAIRVLLITAQSIGVGEPFTGVQATLTGIGQTEVNPPSAKKEQSRQRRK